MDVITTLTMIKKNAKDIPYNNPKEYYTGNKHGTDICFGDRVNRDHGSIIEAHYDVGERYVTNCRYDVNMAWYNSSDGIL